MPRGCASRWPPRTCRSPRCRRRSRRKACIATLQIVASDLRTRFGIDAPRIAVCGLNPHAGEGGYLGREEIDVIAPAIAALRDGRHRRHRPGARRHGIRSAHGEAIRLHRRHVPRPGPARAEAGELRPRRQRHPGPADRAHVGRSRHRARPCRRPGAGAVRRPGKPDRRHRAGDRDLAATNRARAHATSVGSERRSALAHARTSIAQALRPEFPGRPALRRADHRRHRAATRPEHRRDRARARCADAPVDRGLRDASRRSKSIATSRRASPPNTRATASHCT